MRWKVEPKDTGEAERRPASGGYGEIEKRPSPAWGKRGGGDAFQIEGREGSSGDGR